ncbi:MAG: right-handed parallel beta-helix repeat-containing protein, partial [Planctomycetota bacterium]
MASSDPPTLPPATIRVPDPSGPTLSIQAGIDAAYASTDPQVVIVVAPGTYAENLTIDLSQLDAGQELVIASSDGPDTTIIDGGRVDRAVLVEATGPIAFGASLRFGWVVDASDDLSDHAGWHGFTIELGSIDETSVPPMGAGVLIDGADMADPLVSGSIEFRGNVIRDNDANGFTSGAGVAVAGSTRVSFIVNEIHDNTLEGWEAGVGPGGGAGVFSVGSELQLARDAIHHNGFAAIDADLDAEGGGVAVRNGSITLCESEIHHNQGKRGGGVWIHVGDSSTPAIQGFVHLESNVIADNGVWLPPNPATASTQTYLGDGLYVEALEVNPYTLEIWNNDFHRNDIFVPSGFSSGPVGASPTEAGGGVFLWLILPDEVFPSIEGNFLRNNRAQDQGGGAWLYARHLAPGAGQLNYVKFFNNSMVGNTLDDTATGVGAGYFAAGEPTLGAGAGNTKLRGDSNLVFSNVPFQDEWYAECPFDPGAPLDPTEPWGYSQMLPPGATLDCSSTPHWDLFAGTANDDADPDIRVDQPPDFDPRLKDVGSPCVDTANPSPDLDITEDIDGQVRRFDVPTIGNTGVDLDRGGDELFLLR